MLSNLPVHFDDPAFRADALRGIGAAVDRIQLMIGRLSCLRDKIDLKPVALDLRELVQDAVENLNVNLEVKFVSESGHGPAVFADPEQIPVS